MRIQVIKAFRLTLQDHTVREFTPGVHEVPAEIAEHWYVQAHAEAAPAPAAPKAPVKSK